MSKFGTQIKPKFLCEVSFKFIFSHSFIFDYITYDMNPDKVLKNNLLTLEDKLFINSKILDDISGQTIPHKKRWLEPLIKYFIANTNWSLTDVLRVEPESGKLIVAYRIMQYIIVSSTKLPWTTVRQQYIAFLFTPCLVPNCDVFSSDTNVQTTNNETQTENVNYGEEPTTTSSSVRPCNLEKATQTDQAATESKICKRVQIKRRFSNSWKNTAIIGFRNLISQNAGMSSNSKLFWDAVVRYADQNKFSVNDLMMKFLEEAESRKSKGGKRRRDVNHIKIVVNALFQTDDMDRRERLREELTLASKTEHWSHLLHLIRKRLEITGLGRNIIPSIRTLQRESSLLIQCFYEAMRPQHTYSGFRIDLVTAVNFVVFFKLKKQSLSGINIDIWGDGAEIGKVNVTRLAFRILNRETEVSAQSVDSVFTFACFRGEFFGEEYHNLPPLFLVKCLDSFLISFLGEIA